MSQRRAASTCARLAALLAAVAGCHLAECRMSRADEFEYEAPRRKTLLTWTVDSPADAAADEPDPIITDRPHFSEASNLVGLGRVQIETGYTFFRDTRQGSVVQTHSFPEPLLRAGIFADWFEFRLGYNYLVESNDDPVLGHRRLSGSDDLYVAAKLALAQQAGVLPEVALFPQLRVPTGSRAFTSGQVLPGFNLAYTWKLTDWVELECNTQLNRRQDNGGTYYTEFIQTANFEYTLTERLGAFTEWFCFVPSGATVAESQHYFHAGFTFLITRDLQLDLHSAVGLNEAATDLAYTGAGLSARF